MVLATPDPQYDAALWHLDSGAAVVTTSDDCDDVEALLSLAHTASTRGRTVVVGAAAAPGLTGLLARLAADELDTVDEIHVAIHGTGGPACARQHHDALGSASRVWYDGVWQERPGGTGRELCWFPDPIGAHDCYRAALPDPILLHRSFPEAQRITARITGDPSRPPDGPAADAATTSPRGPGRRGAGRGPGHRGASPLGDHARGRRPSGCHRRVRRPPSALTAALRGCLPPGLVVPGQADCPPPTCSGSWPTAGVAVHRFVGTASQTSW